MLGHTGDSPRQFQLVDALRSYAIFGVILFHAGQLVPDAYPWVKRVAGRGGLGVQLFFVVSAFTLFWSLHSRSSSDRRPVAAFFIRRFFRIVPLFWVGILYYFGHPDPFQSQFAPNGVDLSSLFATAVLVHGWYPTTFNSVVPGGWSVGAEAMFYLTVPLLFRVIRSFTTAVVLTVAGGVAVSALTPVATSLIARQFPADWFGLVRLFVTLTFPAQFLVFFAGIAVYFSVLNQTPDSTRPGSLVIRRWTAIVLVISVVGLWFASESVIAAVVFGFIARALSLRDLKLLVNGATAFVGRVSYSAYVWHFCLLDWVAVRLIPVLRQAWPTGPLAGTGRLLVLVVAVVSATLPVAWISYRLIELPGIAFGRWIVTVTRSGPSIRVCGTCDSAQVTV